MGFGKRSIDYEKELKQCYATIASQAARIQQLEAEVVELKKLLAGKGQSKTAKKPRFTENYSFDRTGRNRGHKDSTGRRRNDAKQDLIEEHQKVYWPDAAPEACICHRRQFALTVPLP